MGLPSSGSPPLFASWSSGGLPLTYFHAVGWLSSGGPPLTASWSSSGPPLCTRAPVFCGVPPLTCHPLQRSALGACPPASRPWVEPDPPAARPWLAFMPVQLPASGRSGPPLAYFHYAGLPSSGGPPLTGPPLAHSAITTCHSSCLLWRTALDLSSPPALRPWRLPSSVPPLI